MSRLVLVAMMTAACSTQGSAKPAPNSAQTTTTAPPAPPPSTTVAPPNPHPPSTTAGQSSTLEDSSTTTTSPVAKVLACIRHYESRGVYTRVSRSGKYRGAYQFDQRTWRSQGGSGDPALASPSEQDARAASLYHSRGLSPWPTPNRRCRG